FQCVNQESAIFGIVWLAFGGLAELRRGGGKIVVLQGEQAKVKREIIFVRIQVASSRERGNRGANLALAGERKRQVVQDFGQFGAADHVELQILLKLAEDFLGPFRLV